MAKTTDESEQLAAEALGLKPDRPSRDRVGRTTSVVPESRPDNHTANSNRVAMRWTEHNPHAATAAAGTQFYISSWCLVLLAIAAGLFAFVSVSASMAIVSAVLYLGSIVADFAAKSMSAAAHQSAILQQIRDDQRLSARYRDQSS